MHRGAERGGGEQLERHRLAVRQPRVRSDPKESVLNSPPARRAAASLAATAFGTLVCSLGLLGCSKPAAAPGGTTARPVTLLNVSYDPTRELYEAVNQAFAADWLATPCEHANINQRHGGSGQQAR